MCDMVAVHYIFGQRACRSPECIEVTHVGLWQRWGADPEAILTTTHAEVTSKPGLVPMNVANSKGWICLFCLNMPTEIGIILHVLSRKVSSERDDKNVPNCWAAGGVAGWSRTKAGNYVRNTG